MALFRQISLLVTPRRTICKEWRREKEGMPSRGVHKKLAPRHHRFFPSSHQIFTHLCPTFAAPARDPTRHFCWGAYVPRNFVCRGCGGSFPHSGGVERKIQKRPSEKSRPSFHLIWANEGRLFFGEKKTAFSSF